MSGPPVLRGGIIAAGEGRRLRQAGWAMPKPLVPVAGLPLLGHVLQNFRAAGIASVVMIVNEEGRECGTWARSHFPDVDLQVVVKTTVSSLESFLEVAGRLGSGRALVSTVDAVCPAEAFLAFLQVAQAFPQDATVLAVTPLVDDERPLWVTLDGAGRVMGIAGESGDVVAAGMYLVPERVRRLAPPPDVRRLREFLAWLVQRGEPVYGVVLPAVVDVDRAADVALAEGLACRGRPPSSAPGGAG